MGEPSISWRETLALEFDMRIAEGQYLECLRDEVSDLLTAPGCSPAEFIRGFDSLVDHGPGQNHPLLDWLEAEADSGELRWFLRQEAAGGGRV